MAAAQSERSNSSSPQFCIQIGSKKQPISMDTSESNEVCITFNTKTGTRGTRYICAGDGCQNDSFFDVPQSRWGKKHTRRRLICKSESCSHQKAMCEVPNCENRYVWYPLKKISQYCKCNGECAPLLNHVFIL